MSFFMYNQNGEQAIARPIFEDSQAGRQREDKLAKPSPAMPKHHVIDNADLDTKAPSQNFVYDFEAFRYWVRDSWRRCTVTRPTVTRRDRSMHWRRQ